MESMNRNTQLRDIHKEWKAQVFNPFLKGKENDISVPFCPGLSDEYLSESSSGKRIVIIGQETRDFTTNHDSWRTEGTQSWAIDYLRCQIYGKVTDGIKYNSSPFWNFFRFFADNGLVPCWNNLDKAHRYVDGYTKPLTAAYERILNVQYSTQMNPIERSTLQREIDVAKPDLIVFVTGPYYQVSMCCAFGLQEDTLAADKPTKKNPVSKITLPGISIPVFWTYHPAYLQRSHMLEDVGKRILEELGFDTVPSTEK